MNDKINDPLISVIILNYNSKEYLIKCLQSIISSNYKNLEIIIVDNNSKDSSHKKCKDSFPEIKLIENKSNVGFCEGNNIGIRQAKGEFVVILNPDTQIENNLFHELLNAFLKNGDGLYQPKIMFMDTSNTINTTGNLTQLFGFGYSRGYGQKDIGQYDLKKEMNFVSGACFFTSLNIIKKIGLFDSFLYMTHDDQELGWRSALYGIPSYFVPSATIYHVGGHVFKWSKMRYYFLERNRMYLLLTMYSRITFLKILPFLVIIDVAMMFFYLSKGCLSLKIKGYFDILKNWKHISQKYKTIQNTRKISDSEIIRKFSDEIQLPTTLSNTKINKITNLMLVSLSRIAKKIL